MQTRIRDIFSDCQRLHDAVALDFGPRIERVVIETARRLQAEGRIYILGNGGSAADALHWSGELLGRFQLARPGIPAIALVDNPAVLTAVANDLGYEQIFARQLDALARPADVVWAISTSGTSPNIVAALQTIRERGCFRVAFTGGGPHDLSGLVDELFAVPSRATPRIQEIHALLGHTLCELIEARLYGGP